MVPHEYMPDIRLGAEQPEHPTQTLAPQANDLRPTLDQIGRFANLIVVEPVEAGDDRRSAEWRRLDHRASRVSLHAAMPDQKRPIVGWQVDTEAALERAHELFRS